MIVLMAYGESQEHEAPPTLELGDLPWNTHDTIREWMDVPTDPEFFGDWLVYFYDVLNPLQRRQLRKQYLSELSQSDYPKPPHQRSQDD